MIVPVPDSGVPAALGFAQESGIPFDLGIIRNHYVGRTFIEPTQQIRQLGVRLKHNANRAVVAGKRIVLVDDSIVRGTTSTKIVQMMREAGAQAKCICASPRRRSRIRIITASTRRTATICWPPPIRWKRCAPSSARIRSPSCRSTASTARWASTSAIRCARNSPTIASPANIRPRSPTRARSPYAAAIVAARRSELKPPPRCSIIPPHFRETDVAVLQAHIRAIGFGSLTTIGKDGGLLISHFPVMLDTSVGPFGQLRCHVARANPQWRDSDFAKPGVAMFMGPDAYVSPCWYPSKKEHGKAVPTWNYVTVCARGMVEVYDDRDAAPRPCRQS